MRRGRSTLAALAIALGLLVALLGSSAQAAERLAWIAPGGARVVRWGDGAQPVSRALDPAKPAELGPDELLVLPADPGDRFEIRGELAAVGLGGGALDTPDVITWLPLPKAAAGRREVGVPPWSSARYLVLRPAGGAAPAPLSVRVAARESSGMAWYRLDEDVAAWMLAGGPAPRALTAPLDETGTALAEARPLLRWLAAAREALSAPGGAAPRDDVGEAAGAWLVARYVEGSLQYRPLIEPYFVRRSVEVEGGAEGAPLEPVEHATAWRSGAARPGGAAARIRLTSAADVLRLGLRARASGPARAIVRAGGAVVREIAWRTSPRLMDPARWTDARWIRAALPVGARELTVEVVQGEVAVAAIGHRQRVGVADFFAARRDRAELLDRAAGQRASLAGALAAADRAPSPAAAKAAVAASARAGGAVRALVLAEAARWAGSPAEARERAAAAFMAARGAPDAMAAPILRAAIERLAAAHADPVAPPAGAAPPPWAGWGATLALRPGVDPDDAAALAALSDALSLPADGRRPAAGAEADRYAAAHGDIPGAAARARQAWAREGRWVALDAAPGVSTWSSVEEPRDVLPEQAAGAAPSCAVEGSHGLRWTVLDRPRAVFPVDAPPGAHARVLIRGVGAEPEPESVVRVDGVPVSVHAGAGVASVVAVAPGERAFERAEGAPVVLARIPRTGQAPCASLRDITQWAWVQGEAVFHVPDRDRATVARILVAPGAVAAAAQPGEAARARPMRLRASVAGASYEAWVRPGATGAVEVPVPVGAGELRVTADEALLLRASALLHPALPPPQRAVVPRGGGPSAPVEHLLQAIREATRALRGAPDEEKPRIRERRAAALEQLGFPSLAALDRAPPFEVSDFDLETEPSHVLYLPFGSPPVVPLGLLSRLGPLPLPADLGPLRAARGARGAGDPRRALEALRPAAGRDTAADTLLLALIAERQGEARLGGDAFLRIGLDHREGRALARAANLATDLAAAEDDRILTLRAFAIAELAVQASAARAQTSGEGDPWPDPAPAALARLAPVIAWRAPPRADRTAGTASLEVRARPEPEQPLPFRVRHALVDAPGGALLMTEGSYAQLRFDRPTPIAVALDGACRLLDPAETPCALEVRLDDEQVSCAVRDAPEGLGGIRCTVEIPAGRHRLEVRPPPESQVLAWARAVAAGASQPHSTLGGFAGTSPAAPPNPYAGRVMSTWNDIDPERPLELAFAGPTVVRLRARPAYECASTREGRPADDPDCRPAVTTTAPAGALRVSVAALNDDGSTGAALEASELALDATEDPLARRSGVNRPPYFWLGNEVERRIAVLAEGPHVLRVHSPAGRALVRVEIAVPTGVPRPRVPPPPPAPLPPEPSIGAGLRWAPPVGEDPDEGALMLAGYVRTVDGNMTDEDLRAGIRFYEIGVDASREVVPGFFWAGATAFTRLRTGTNSLGVELRADTAGDGWLPSFTALGRLVAQPPAVGGRASLTAEWAVPIEEVTLLPQVGAAVLAVDESLAGRADADRDVYTLYSSTRRTQGHLGVRARLRPAVDAIVSVGPSLRLAPLFTTLDRVELRADLDLLPGSGLWPWMQFGWVGSYRPTSELREEAFLRNTFSLGAMFWSWFARGHRISLSGETQVLVDSPATQIESPRLGFAIELRYMWTGSRGLRDLPPRVTPFRDRLEEDSGVIHREAPAAEPRWEDEEE